MNRLLILSAMVLMMPIVPALACFDDGTLFRTTSEGAHGGRSFDRSPIPMSYCESGEHGFVVVMGKCYDQDAITDYDTEEECQADAVCKAYREQQKQNEEPEPRPPCQPSGDLDVCIPWEDEKIIEEPEPNPGPNGDPNHGEIKGDEELEQDQSEEEHQEEEDQGQETTEETTAETVE